MASVALQSIGKSFAGVPLLRDINLDIGERVHVAGWGADRTARVSYRGSIWSARLQPGAPAYSGEHIVAAVEGNWLVLVPRVAANH